MDSGVALKTVDAVNGPDKLRVSGIFTVVVIRDCLCSFYYVSVLSTIPEERF